MNNYLKNSIVQLLAMLAFAVSVIVLAPLVLTLGSLDVIDWPAGMVLAVACVHFGVIAAQVAMTGDLVPRRWNAVCFLAVPALYVCVIAITFRLDAMDWFLRAIVLEIHSVYITSLIVRSAMLSVSRWRHAVRPVTLRRVNGEDFVVTDRAADRFPMAV